MGDLGIIFAVDEPCKRSLETVWEKHAESERARLPEGVSLLLKETKRTDPAISLLYLKSLPRRGK